MQALQERVAPEDGEISPLPTTSSDDGERVDAVVWNGPPTPKRYEPTQMTIQFSMIVVITSCAPTVALQEPGDARERGAGEHRREDRRRMSRTPGRSTCSGICVATRTAAIEPARYWPCPPMLKSPQRKAKATASPVSTSGDPEDERLLEVRRRDRPDVVGVPREPHARVGEREADVVAADLEEPGEPRSAEDRLVGLERVANAPVVRKTTNPPMRKASTTVSTGATSPPPSGASQ